MRLGLFGGTFDPVHTGHLILAETIRTDYPLDKILFIPAGMPPHKRQRRISPSQDRVEMLTLALENHPFFGISSVELEKEGVCYTIDTVRYYIHQTDPEDDLFLIIGGDSLHDLLTWKQPHALLECIQVLVVKRPGYSMEEVNSDIKDKVHFIEMPLIEISSTVLRERVRSGLSIRYQVPDKVEAYIREKDLYR